MQDADVKVLSSFPGEPGKFWGDNTTLVSPYCTELMFGKKRGIFHRFLLIVKVVWALIEKRNQYDVIVLEGSRAEILFLLLQSIVLTKKTPIVLEGCRWYVPNSSFKRKLKKHLMSIIDRSVDKYMVWAQHEIQDYAAEFGIDQEKICFVPFHTTLDGYDFIPSDDGCVFAGGNGDRDYGTLIEAVRGLDIKVFIAATKKDLFNGIDIPDNVTVQGVSPGVFREKMASCRMAVVPMQQGLLHSGGQQTFLNSMVMGKPTIVVGEKAAAGYIVDGENGVIIKYGDYLALRNAIIALQDSPELRSKIGAASKAYASQMTTEKFIRTIYDIAVGLVQAGRRDQ